MKTKLGFWDKATFAFLVACVAVLVGSIYFVHRGDKPPATVTQAKSDNPTATVDRIFKVDGCTVYRFRDYPPYGPEHYFARCEGASAANVEDMPQKHPSP